VRIINTLFGPYLFFLFALNEKNNLKDLLYNMNMDISTLLKIRPFPSLTLFPGTSFTLYSSKKPIMAGK
jgi:hypothetical protein